MDAAGEIRQLSQILGLKNEPQDWGIINSDPSRALEFIQFRETEHLTQAQQYALCELVFASMNDHLEEGVADGELLDRFEQFLTRSLYGLPDQIKYWSSLHEIEFPIAGLLHRLETHA